jgi:hypothetical protein
MGGEMCKQGTYASVTIKRIHASGTSRVLNITTRLSTIDACIAPIVQVLNDSGLETVACCCGHGNFPGVISLKDGREILIARNYDEARLMESIVPKHEELQSANTPSTKNKCKFADSGWCNKLNYSCLYIYEPENCCESGLVESYRRLEDGE